MIEITDINDERLTVYRALNRPKIHADSSKMFVVESEKVTRVLLESSFPVVSFFALPEYHKRYGTILDKRGVPEEMRFTASKEIMNEIVGFPLHTGIMATSLQPQSALLDKMRMPAVALNAVADAENIGAIVRNCAGFGVSSLLLDSLTCTPYIRRAVRVSMGAIFSMETHITSSLPATLRTLRQRYGCTIIGAELTPESLPISDVIFPERSVIVFGSEGAGISPEVLAECSCTAQIPMAQGVQSFNVTAATAVFLYAMNAQRKNWDKTAESKLKTHSMEIL